MFAFSSNTRNDIRITNIKEFSEPWTALSEFIIKNIKPGFSTRTGASLRYAEKKIHKQIAFRKLILLISDGEPFDIDIDDPKYLIEDARFCVQSLRKDGINVCCFAVGSSANPSLERVYGKGNYFQLSALENLNDSLASVYQSVAR